MFSKIQKLLLVFLLFSLSLFAEQYYIYKDAVNLVELLAPAPKPGSLEDKEDMNTVLKAQSKGTKAQGERACDDANLMVFRFADVMGADFTTDKLPIMAALFEIIWVKCCMKIWGHYNHRKNKTSGHVWQGRYKSFMAKKDSYYIGVMRYIEANALRAGLVEKVEDWIYGLLYARALPNAHLGGPLVELGDG